MKSPTDTEELTPKQELFCKYFASDKEFFGNGTAAYMEAYPDTTYAAARSSASVFLTNPNILNRINEILETGILNDQFVDKQLAFLVTQNANLSTKLGAIREYNSLKKRIVKQLDVDINPNEQLLEDIIRDMTNDPSNLSDFTPISEAIPEEASILSN